MKKSSDDLKGILSFKDFNTEKVAEYHSKNGKKYSKFLFVAGLSFLHLSEMNSYSNFMTSGISM